MGVLIDVFRTGTIMKKLPLKEIVYIKKWGISRHPSWGQMIIDKSNSENEKYN
jgi:hypothetical protein